MATSAPGLVRKYDVARLDGRPLRGGRCVVLEAGDRDAHPALLAWADTLEGRGDHDLAADVRSLVAENSGA